MTDLDDLPFNEPLTPANPAATPRKCVRHEWLRGADVVPLVGAPLATGVAYCARCGVVRDEIAARRNKNNRLRGGAFERAIAKRYNGRRTGPLLGRDDVMVGQVFAIQTKRAQRLSLNEARTYLDDLRRIYPDRIPVVVHALPGERDGIVIWRLNDHVAEHGKDGLENG